MDDWKREFSRAKYYLSRHRPDIALKKLEKALAGCPVSHARDLAQVLFFLGITLRKLGLCESALKSWNAGSRVDRGSSAARMLKRFQNEYGMKKQASREQDDWQAFFAIHLNRYIRGKSSLALGTLAERDMVTDLIRERFLLLRKEYALDRLGTGEKYRLFHQVIIVFPRFSPETPSKEQPIWVDFTKKQRILPDDSCFCGSGRPFMQCCGRTPGVSELMNGLL